MDFTFSVIYTNQCPRLAGKCNSLGFRRFLPSPSARLNNGMRLARIEEQRILFVQVSFKASNSQEPRHSGFSLIQLSARGFLVTMTAISFASASATDKISRSLRSAPSESAKPRNSACQQCLGSATTLSSHAVNTFVVTDSVKPNCLKPTRAQNPYPHRFLPNGFQHLGSIFSISAPRFTVPDLEKLCWENAVWLVALPRNPAFFEPRSWT